MKNILDSVLGNVGSVLIFRIGAIDSQMMETYTKPELLAQDLQDIPDYHVVGRLLVNNSPVRPFVFQTLEPPKISDNNHADTIVEMSRKKYTKPVIDVELAIETWRRNYKHFENRVYM